MNAIGICHARIESSQSHAAEELQLMRASEQESVRRESGKPQEGERESLPQLFGIPSL